MKARFFTELALKVTFAILSCAPSFSSAQECVQITAQITQTNLVKLGIAPPYWTFPVTCSVWSNRWRIDQWRIESRYARNGLEVAYYDGTNVYSSQQIVPDGKANGRSGVVTVTIAPSPGGHPLGNLGVNIPWLAFCSGGYLKMRNRTIPVPVMDVPGYADSLSCVDKTTTFDDEGGLPKTVELLTSRERYLNSLSDERLFRNPVLLNAQRTRGFGGVADGLLRFRYEVEASTNFNGRLFPTVFRYFDYRRLNKEDRLSLVAEGTGTVTLIAEAGAPGNVFSTNAFQTVIDLRFRQRDKLLDAITYVWPKSEVPATNEPALQQRLKEMVSRAAAVESPE